MKRATVLWILALAGSGVVTAAQRATPAARPGSVKVSTAAECAADLGVGVKSRRAFCDVVVAARPAESIAVPVPAHVGTATLRFDLHNRFAIPVLAVPGPLAFARHEALIAVVRADGTLLGKAAAVREFRTVSNLFDQIGGGARPGGVKAIGPGPAESVEFIIPAGVETVGIVGLRLKVLTKAGTDVFDSPGRPVAIVSNIRLEYRPATR